MRRGVFLSLSLTHSLVPSSPNLPNLYFPLYCLDGFLRYFKLQIANTFSLSFSLNRKPYCLFYTDKLKPMVYTVQSTDKTKRRLNIVRRKKIH